MNIPLPSPPNGESLRVFVLPFNLIRSREARIQPNKIRQKVTAFLKANGVETDRWRQAWDRIEEVVGDDKIVLYNVITLGQFFLQFFIIYSGLYVGDALQQVVCFIHPTLHYQHRICPDREMELWEQPFLLACVFFCIYEACVFPFLVQQRVAWQREGDKVLIGILNKIRYVCDDLNDGSIYFCARVNFGLNAITVDVSKSKPPTIPMKKRTDQSEKQNEKELPLVEIV